MESNSTESNKEECFIIMPISEVERYENDHFRKVYENIFKPACINAGYEPKRADQVKETNLIHVDILKRLVSSPMAICDLSDRNPNVLFELGLRQAFDLPTLIVQEKGTPAIFDIAILRITTYHKEMLYEQVLSDQIAIKEALEATKKADQDKSGVNSLVNLLSLSTPARLKDPQESDTNKMLQIIMEEINDLKADMRKQKPVKNVYNKLGVPWSNSDSWEYSSLMVESFYLGFISSLETESDRTAIEKSYNTFYNRAQQAMSLDLSIQEKNRVRDMISEAEKRYNNYIFNFYK